ncbi:MAG: hypothetical protein E3J60_00440 [Dehalococcoidia bacterium]|nr:MAG: hypothetical protein E3J60_00440 [Dehalococcoidia bacterium]
MALSDQDKKLLNDIFSASLKSPKGINLARFRADNEQFIPELDKLEILGYLQRRNDLYSINTLALAYLAKENTDAQSIVQKCGFVFALLKSDYRDNLGKAISFSDIARKTGLSVDDVRVAFSFIIQIPILEGYSIKEELIAPSEGILKYKSFEDILKEQEEWDKRRYKQPPKSRELLHIRPEYPVEQKTLLSATLSKANWKAIENEFGITKTGFGKKINFITDPFKRTIIFRDVEQAFVLASLGFSKSAVILAGSVIEELLRLYLEYKGTPPLSDNFDGYIRTCEQHGLLKDSVSRLSDSVRHFRNLVHLSKEETNKHTISKSTAIGAVSSIFTIATDF